MSTLPMGSKKRIERGWYDVPANEPAQAFLYHPLCGHRKFAGKKAIRSLIFGPVSHPD